VNRRKRVDTTETIFALTTGALPSAVAIVKVDGDRAFLIAEKIFVGDIGLSTTPTTV
jgi:tRNA U34 5-carboxymethylaminomethyl modifying GTPase MnmE/TrmE